MYLMLKHSHMLIAALTVLIFIVRGSFMFRESAALNHKFLRIAPHILYTLLLASGIALAVTLSFKLSEHIWLQAKFACLIAFIALAVFTFKLKSKGARVACFIAALVVFANIFVIAFSKSPWGMLPF
jgi:uncharacterized membrane protein SirB2